MDAQVYTAATAGKKSIKNSPKRSGIRANSIPHLLSQTRHPWHNLFV